ncbi:MAG TPA: ABC transporter permease subunit [Rariglobus sp.]|jgi:nitrate/nitrite transport system permease protein|nr:ABC transporter permease subunit [Rariglobus sp.]
MQFKYRLLKAIDIAGLQILDPVVRLAYREEPKVQLKRIGLFIVIPTLTFIAFIGLWAWLAPLHTTKAGEVPTPKVVWQAAKGIWRFHERENTKSDDFSLGGQARIDALAAVDKRIGELEPQAQAANTAADAAETASRTHLAEALAPLNKAYSAKRREFADAVKARQTSLLELSQSVQPGDTTGAKKLLEAVTANATQSAAEAAEIQQLREKRKAVEDHKDPALAQARATSNALEEELQFLRKRHDLLSTGNNTLRLDELATKLAETKTVLASAATPAERLALSQSIIAQEDALTQAKATTYSRPWTLPDQIGRSLRCMFLGFIIASCVAIPLGLLCGLSRVVMAALTPLISLFKPVSPIVWLPIIFIIVGGFIPDPSNSAILNFFNAVPGFTGISVNPAFLASAVTVALCSLWPTLVNTALGVAAVDKDHMNVAKVLRLGVVARLFKIIIPSALPLIFAGLRISLGVGWMVLIAAELLSSSEGIGKFVWDMFNNGSSQTFAQMFVVVFVVGIIGLILDRIMIVFQRLVSFDGAPTSL